MRFTTTDNPRAARVPFLLQHVPIWEQEWANNDAAAFVARLDPNPETPVAVFEKNKKIIETFHEAALAELAELGVMLEVKAETPPTVVDEPTEPTKEP